MLDFAHQVFVVPADGGPPVELPGTGPRYMARYFNALGRAMDAITHDEHPDIGPALPLLNGWLNAANVR